MTYQRKADREALATYERILEAFGRGDFSEMDLAFRTFCVGHKIPAWYIDEASFQAMKLWKAERRRDLLRHFAAVLDRVCGHEVCWDPAQAAALEEALAV